MKHTSPETVCQPHLALELGSVHGGISFDLENLEAHLHKI